MSSQTQPEEKPLRLSKLQQQILETVNSGGSLVAYRTPANTACFRLRDKDSKPVRNIQPRTFRALLRRGKLKKDQTGRFIQA